MTSADQTIAQANARVLTDGRGIRVTSGDRTVEISERDRSLLCGLFEARIMTAKHLAALYFAGNDEAAKKRLQKLKAVGLVAERARRVNDPSILFLTRKGFKLLEGDGSLSRYPPLGVTSFERRTQVSALTLQHELEVMDVKAALQAALSKSGQFILNEFTTWPMLCQFEISAPGANILVKPDGFMNIHERERDGGLSEHSFFLEVDRSTETQATLVDRAQCYRQHYTSGGFARSKGANSDEYKAYPFRVLVVLKTPERRNNTAERLLLCRPPISSQVYLTTMNEVTSMPLHAIWVRPMDYRQVTDGTAFQSGRQSSGWGYLRQTAREIYVEKNIRKVRFLVDET